MDKQAHDSQNTVTAVSQSFPRGRCTSRWVSKGKQTMSSIAADQNRVSRQTHAKPCTQRATPPVSDRSYPAPPVGLNSQNQYIHPSPAFHGSVHQTGHLNSAGYNSRQAHGHGHGPFAQSGSDRNYAAQPVLNAQNQSVHPSPAFHGSVHQTGHLNSAGYTSSQAHGRGPFAQPGYPPDQSSHIQRSQQPVMNPMLQPQQMQMTNRPISNAAAYQDTNAHTNAPQHNPYSPYTDLPPHRMTTQMPPSASGWPGHSGYVPVSNVPAPPLGAYSNTSQSTNGSTSIDQSSRPPPTLQAHASKYQRK